MFPDAQPSSQHPRMDTGHWAEVPAGIYCQGAEGTHPPHMADSYIYIYIELLIIYPCINIYIYIYVFLYGNILLHMQGSIS